MITIVEPKAYIAKLWGEQRVMVDKAYRLMKYVIRVDQDDNVLLHNVVTGQLVVLNQEEAEEVDYLPKSYSPEMEQLVAGHYLVPVGHDEHEQIINLRYILRSLDELQKPKGVITHYTILPTTACNARCYYCFEQGCKTVTMTKETSNNVVNYIDRHCGRDRLVYLSWFGGEPTIAANRISHICKELQKKQIYYKSDMTTNGYLLNNALIDEAVNIWKLESCMICVDGTEDNYNKTKSYVTVHDSPYQRVMENISNLMDNGVRVHLRMNFDLDNYKDFADLINDVTNRFNDKSLLQVSAHPLFGEYVNPDGRINHASNKWFEKKIVELNNLAREAGLLGRSGRLPSIEFRACQAYSESSVTITPKGDLVRCPEQFGDEEVTGNVIGGMTNKTVVEAWKHYADLQMCRMCCLMPICQKNERCMSRDVCCYYSEHLGLFQSAIVEAYERRV